MKLTQAGADLFAWPRLAASARHWSKGPRRPSDRHDRIFRRSRAHPV